MLKIRKCKNRYTIKFYNEIINIAIVFAPLLNTSWVQVYFFCAIDVYVCLSLPK
jgi:hypothetical protein